MLAVRLIVGMCVYGRMRCIRWGLACEREGDLAGAVAQLCVGLVQAEDNEDRMVAAYLHRALGGVYVKMGEGKGREHLQQALTLFQAIGLPAEAAETEQLI